MRIQECSCKKKLEVKTIRERDGYLQYKIRGMWGSRGHRKKVSSFMLRMDLNGCRII